MQSAREEIKHVDHSVSLCVANVSSSQSAVVEAESILREMDRDAHLAARELTACDLRLEAAQQRHEKLATSLKNDQSNLLIAESRLLEINDLVLQSETAYVESGAKAGKLEQSQQFIAIELSECEQALQVQSTEVTDHRIQLARIEQRVVGLRTTLEQMHQDSAERMRTVAQAQLSIESIAAKIASALVAATDFQEKSTAAQARIQLVESRRVQATEQIQLQNAALPAGDPSL